MQVHIITAGDEGPGIDRLLVRLFFAEGSHAHKWAQDNLELNRQYHVKTIRLVTGFE